MSFDGIFTYCMKNELKEALLGGRVSKIYQPFKNELVLQIRANGQNHRVLLSVHPSYARVHLTNETYENPAEPPMFCMLLRKHLEGSIVENIEQPGMERIIMFEFKTRNELGDLSYKQLIIEIMGRHSNIVLIDKERNMIFDSIKHLSPAMNRHRTVLPGHPYVFPPKQDKVNPFEADEETILKKLDFNQGKLVDQLVASFAGISPLLGQEIVFKAGLANRNTLPKAFMEVIKAIQSKKISPSIVFGEQKEVFYLFPLSHVKGERKTYESLSELLDRFYYGKAERDRVKQQGHDLERFILNERKKNANKVKKLKKTLMNAEKADEYKLLGELLTANMFIVQKGDKEIDVINYYDEQNGTVKIPLDPMKTPSENAQSYFQKYQKAKNSIDIVQEQIHKAEEEVDYFDRLIQQLETAAPKDLEEIRDELAEGGYLKRKGKGTLKRKKQGKPELETYVASDGTEIIVGKNNKQNEYLTNKLARRDEIWLHTKDIPGSHVVIRSENPSEETIFDAAHLAAYFSKARQSSSVPVDFTKIRHVKKPSGSKPGFVTYEGQQTVYVTPDEEKVLRMRK
ncbi:NFACT RNA binding domain-containing protein [Bacillus sp. FJAT-47783]|uniref:Rqc2 family fibronectin-binding protein n=1 Tax=Bacillus sp. FJAT-47783 TaxID=2922712 RepID=UPI001FAC6FFF|nr:NFACT RNA binding domain-containing protein [Bacillus sp. FJAT-47783]